MSGGWKDRSIPFGAAGHTLYVEPTWNDQARPPVFAAVITQTMDDSRWQIGPLVLLGKTRRERQWEAMRYQRDVMRMYGSDLPPLPSKRPEGTLTREQWAEVMTTGKDPR